MKSGLAFIYVIILDSCMSFLFVYSDSNYNKIRGGSIDCGHEGFWLFPNGVVANILA